MLVPNASFGPAIQAALNCLQACEACAKRCLEAPEVSELTQVVSLSWECAAACDGAAKALLRESQYALEWVTLCASVCQACALECDRHAPAQVCCAQCAAACRVCIEACSKVTLLS